MSSSLDKVGFIGTGNMATAIIKGLIENGVNSKYVYAYDIDSEKLNKISKEYNITVVTSNIDVLEMADIIFLAVKPNIYPIILNEIKMLLQTIIY